MLYWHLLSIHWIESTGNSGLRLQLCCRPLTEFTAMRTEGCNGHLALIKSSFLLVSRAFYILPCRSWGEEWLYDERSGCLGRLSLVREKLWAFVRGAECSFLWSTGMGGNFWSFCDTFSINQKNAGSDSCVCAVDVKLDTVIDFKLK